MSQVVRQECGKCEPRRDGGGGDDERCERGCIIVVKRLGAAITSLSLPHPDLTHPSNNTESVEDAHGVFCDGKNT